MTGCDSATHYVTMMEIEQDRHRLENYSRYPIEEIDSSRSHQNGTQNKIVFTIAYSSLALINLLFIALPDPSLEINHKSLEPDENQQKLYPSKLAQCGIVSLSVTCLIVLLLMSDQRLETTCMKTAQNINIIALSVLTATGIGLKITRL